MSSSNGGTHITTALYNGYTMLTEAWQNGFQYKIGNGNYQNLILSSVGSNGGSCSYFTGTDSQGRTTYGSSYKFIIPEPNGKSYTIYYIPTFTLTSSKILLCQTFKYSASVGLTQISSFDGWWKTHFQQGIVLRNGAPMNPNVELATDPVYWPSESFYKDQWHYMYTNTYNFYGPNGYFTEGWAAFQTVTDQFAYYSNANGETLTFPSGGDYVEIDNNGGVLLQNQNYWFNTEWLAVGSD
jgi:hypothetical protein